ncbi:hypothetical protein IKR55_03265 [bacterium]|jgi:hypothetical protein|nr:hypothetical protein [bacterium]
MESQETIMIASKDNPYRDANSYFIVSVDETVDREDFETAIQIIDEYGKAVTCTVDKFVEIFDQEGLTGFIL